MAPDKGETEMTKITAEHAAALECILRAHIALDIALSNDAPTPALLAAALAVRERLAEIKPASLGAIRAMRTAA